MAGPELKCGKWEVPDLISVRALHFILKIWLEQKRSSRKNLVMQRYNKFFAEWHET